MGAVNASTTVTATNTNNLNLNLAVTGKVVVVVYSDVSMDADVKTDPTGSTLSSARPVHSSLVIPAGFSSHEIDLGAEYVSTVFLVPTSASGAGNWRARLYAHSDLALSIGTCS